MTAQEEHTQLFKNLGFRKKWLGDRSGWWWEKSVNNSIFGKAFICVEDDTIYMYLYNDNYSEIYNNEFSEERLFKIISLWTEMN